MAAFSSVEILGGGPAGLYAGSLIKEAIPGAHVRVTEQNPADATFGFGVVFSNKALDFLRADDSRTHGLIIERMQHWQNMTLMHKGEAVTLDGIGFSAIGRLELLRLLQKRAANCGVELRYDYRLVSLDELDADLIIGADGLNSLVRAASPQAFGETIDYFSNRFAWFGTPRPFDTLTQTFVKTEYGAMNAHHYRYAPRMSTFIVECDAESFAAHGFDQMDEKATAEACRAVFCDTLQGAPLIANRSIWRQFPKLWCENWVSGNRVLLGDASHTAHFSIGSGTRLAMEDAIALVRSLRDNSDLDAALATYQRERPPIAKKIVDAANTSARWYENFADKMNLAPLDFAYDYIMRSGRMDPERLRGLAPGFMATYGEYKEGA